MPLATTVRGRPIEYFILHDATPAGPAIGTYAGEAIPSQVVDAWRRRYAYAGVAPRRLDGSFDGEALQPGEFILRPGLVYRLVKPNRNAH